MYRLTLRLSHLIVNSCYDNFYFKFGICRSLGASNYNQRQVNGLEIQLITWRRHYLNVILLFRRMVMQHLMRVLSVDGGQLPLIDSSYHRNDDRSWSVWISWLEQCESRVDHTLSISILNTDRAKIENFVQFFLYVLSILSSQYDEILFKSEVEY